MDFVLFGTRDAAGTAAGPRGGAPGTAATRIYEDLRGRIVGFDLPPDTTLTRSELAERYAVSQTPVREALLRLEQEGLVRVFPQSRTVVTRIDVPQIHETHFLRVAVEIEVATRLVANGDAATIAKARSLIRMQEALGGDVDQIELFNQLDDAFHRALFAGVGQLNLHRLLLARSGHMARARRLDLPKEGKMRDVVRGHLAIVEAIERGETVAAGQAVRDHLAGTVARIADLRKENPGYFSPS